MDHEENERIDYTYEFSSKLLIFKNGQSFVGIWIATIVSPSCLVFIVS